ncbi:MAG: carboxymuconolactone decarboxylase family protein, partial [Gemmatimonadota bacterium]|nr:carboxymuconolactone decarboxylase family protein [Gemmatimonadota bacterium]
MYIATIDENEAEGALQDVYQAFRPKPGFIPDHTSVFSLRPDVLVAWRAFQASIRKNMRLRRYELVTMAAAQALGCRYCLLAHGAILLENGFSIDQLRAILTDYRTAGLEPVEVAAMDFAARVARNANEIRAADVEGMRAPGHDDAQILDTT